MIKFGPMEWSFPLYGTDFKRLLGQTCTRSGPYLFIPYRGQKQFSNNKPTDNLVILFRVSKRSTKEKVLKIIKLHICSSLFLVCYRNDIFLSFTWIVVPWLCTRSLITKFFSIQHVSQAPQWFLQLSRLFSKKQKCQISSVFTSESYWVRWVNNHF